MQVESRSRPTTRLFEGPRISIAGVVGLRRCYCTSTFHALPVHLCKLFSVVLVVKSQIDPLRTVVVVPVQVLLNLSHTSWKSA
jgi:hypothetical protein